MAGRSHDHTMNIAIRAITSGISQTNKELTQIAGAVKEADGKNVSIRVSLSGDAEKQIQSIVTSVGNIEKAMNSINTRGITSLADAGSTASKSMTDLQSQIGAVNKSLDSINSRNLTSISEEAGNVSKSFMDATSSAGAFSSALDSLSAGNLTEIASAVGDVADEFERATSSASAFADISSSASYRGGSSGSGGYYPNWSNSYGGRYGGMRYTGQDIGLSDIVGSLSGGKSPYELTVENALTKQRNKAILSAWPSETGDPTAQMRAYNAFDEATNNSLMSLNALAGGANAFRATANASAEEMEKYAPILADFGGYVMGLGYSEDVAQTAVMKLARGLGGAFTALDQYGITEKSLKNTGYWSGDENDLEGYMMAVKAISGDAMEAIKGTSEYGMKYMGKQASLGGYALGEIEMGLLGPLAGGYGSLDHWLLTKTKDMGLGAKILDAKGNETYRTTEDGREIVSTTGFNVSSILIGASQITQGYRVAKDSILAFVAEYKDLKRLKKFGLKGIFSDYRYDMYGNGSWIPPQHELIKEMEKNQPKQIKAPCPDMSDCPGMNGNGGTKNNKKKKSSNNNKSSSKKKKSNKKKTKKTINNFSPKITQGLNLLDPNNGLDYDKLYHDKEFDRINKRVNNKHNYEGLNSRVKNRKAITNDVNTPTHYRWKDLESYKTSDNGKVKTWRVDTPTNIKMRKGSSSAIMTGRKGNNRHMAENIASPTGYKYKPQIGDYMPEVKSGNKIGLRNKNKNRVIPDWFYKGVEQELPKKYGGIKNGKAINKIGESYIDKKTKRRQIKSKRANNQILGAKGKQNVANFFKEQDNIMKEYKNSKKTKRGRYANKYGGYQKRTLGAIYDVKDLKKRGKSYINAKKQLLNQEFNNMKTNSARMGAEYTQKGRQLPYTAWNRGKTNFSNLSSAVSDKLSNSFLGTQYGALKRQGATVKSSITSSKPYQQIRGNSLALGSMMASTTWGQKITNSRLGKGISSVRQQGVGAVAGKKFSGLRAGISGVGGKVLGGVSKGVGAMAGGIGKIGGAISGIGMGFMSILGPIGAVVGGIMLLTSLLDMLGIDWLSPLQTAFGGFWESMQPVIQGFNEWLQGVAEQIGPFITQLGTVLAPILQTLGSFLAGGLGALAQAIAPILSAIASLFSGDGGGALGENLSNFAGMISGLGPIVEQLWAVIGTGAEGMGNAIASFITSVANGIASAVTTIGTAVTNNITMLSDSITTSITSISTAITTSFMNFAIIVATATATAFLKLMEFQVKAVSLMGSIATDMVNAFKNNFNGIDSKIEAEMSGAYDTLCFWGDKLVAKCEEIGNRMQNALIHLGIGAGSPGKIWTGVDDEFRGTYNAMMGRGNGLISGAYSIGKGVADSFRQSYNSSSVGYVPEIAEPVSPDVGLPKVTEPKLFKQLRNDKNDERNAPVFNFYHTGYLGSEELAQGAMEYFVNKMDFENKRANRTV